MQCGRGCGPWGRACPFPLPAASCLQWCWAGLQPPISSGLAQTLCSAKGRQCVRALPQFKLVTHKSSLRLSSGQSGPVLTLSNAARFSLFRPHLLVADEGIWGTLLLGVAFRHVICGVYLFNLFIFLPVRLPSEIRKIPPDLPV